MPSRYSPENALNLVWRGALGVQILIAGKAMDWTDLDRKLFLTFAARYGWTLDMDQNTTGVKRLQQELLVYTTHPALNTAISQLLVCAVRARLQEVLATTPQVAGWPHWTRRWFLDPRWDGTTAEPAADTPPMPAVTVYGVGETTGVEMQPTVMWDGLKESDRQAFFEAALDKARSLRPVAVAPGSQGMQMARIEFQ